MHLDTVAPNDEEYQAMNVEKAFNQMGDEQNGVASD
ncbi:hypothetical protein Dd586_3262 [Dickeya parazeae Ech586]|uniref:Uncharacterized protein n=1 Tax=Dickeya zeae (strain Ech586) TaxID=590409 RepID=D2BV27_DICZ5|nr:hypothetical protein Dd586_3262 [Dickeya parazeae Ech586]